MNFSDNDLTGVLAELDLERLFASWRWVAGKDRLDIGYDLCVVPDILRFKGARFLVQSKGTSKRKKGTIVAQISKKRLRQYAENPHPVFIVRVTPDGNAYWVHAQEWAKNNIHRLSGDGFSGVRFDKKFTLSDKEAFSSYLESIMRPAHQVSGRLKELANERSQYLSSIDPRYEVKVSVVNGNESYEVLNAPGAEDTAIALKMKLKHSTDNIDRLRDSISFGTPTFIEIDEFSMQDFPLLEEIGLRGPLKGKIEIRHNNSSIGNIFLYPGNLRSITANELAVPARIFSGQKGAVITNEEFGLLFVVIIRLEEGVINLNFSINESSIENRPAQHWNELSNIVEWVEQVLEKNSMRLELLFRDSRLQVPAMLDISSISAFLHMLMLLGKLHALAKHFESNLVLPSSYFFTEQEENDINMAYKILRGEPCPIRDVNFQFNSIQQPTTDVIHDFVITTNFSLVLAGKQLGTIPVKIDLPGYKLTRENGTNNYKVEAKVGNGGTISFFEELSPKDFI